MPINVAPPIPKPQSDYFLIDNIDPKDMIQRIEIHGDSIKIKDNIPVEEARRIFEEELKNAEEPEITAIKYKAEKEDYFPTDEEIAQLLLWLKSPNTFLDEGHLQKMYDYPQGSIWDFFLHAMGIKKIPSPKERIEKNYDSYVHTYNFSDEQIVILRKIKDIFVSNITTNKDIELKDIFGNPIYERLIGSYDTINQKFDGNFPSVLGDMKQTFFYNANT